MSHFSTYLFARPSFAEGMGRVVDFAGTLTEFNREPSAAIADSRAMAADWMAVGEDLANAIAAYRAQVAEGASRVEKK